MTLSYLTKQIDTTKYIEKVLDLRTVKAQYNPHRFKHWLSLHYESYTNVLNMIYSTHYRFLDSYEKNKNLIFSETDYYKLQKLYGRNNEWIINKINKFISLYEHIKNGKTVDPIQVLTKPLLPTAFNDSYEIFEGHHRSACYLFLGKNENVCQEIIR